MQGRGDFAIFWLEHKGYLDSPDGQEGAIAPSCPLDPPVAVDRINIFIY